jgi:hypothetical protein
MTEISKFNGLQNVSDPLRLGLEWLAVADNVEITDTGAISKRAGYSLALAGNITSMYSTVDFSRLYIVDNGALKAINGPASVAVTLRTGLANAPMHWTETNDQVYFSNGTDSGVIAPDNAIEPWRDSPLGDMEFYDAAGNLMPSLLSPLPLGVQQIAYWNGRIYASQYFPSDDQSVIWASQPLGFHLFALDTDFFMVPGEVLMLAPHDQALILGTDTAICAYSGNKLQELAPYGVVPGMHWDTDGSRVLFWSVRGLCAALPFKNLTERQISVSPGLHAGGALVQHKGAKRFLVCLQQGGEAFNQL